MTKEFENTCGVKEGEEGGSEGQRKGGRRERKGDVGGRRERAVKELSQLLTRKVLLPLPK